MRNWMNLLTLTLLAFSISRFAQSSRYGINEDSFGSELETVNAFFDEFCKKFDYEVHNKLQQIESVPSLVHLSSTIQSFAIIARDQLFAQVMGKFHNIQENYDDFLLLYENLIGREMDLIKRDQNAQGDYQIDYIIQNISSELKDSIMLSVQAASEAIKVTQIVRSRSQMHLPSAQVFPFDYDFVDIPEDSSVNASGGNLIENVYGGEDEEIENIIIGASKTTFSEDPVPTDEESEAEIYAQIIRDSPRPFSLSASYELLLSASSVISFGIYPGSSLFPVARSYLMFIGQSGLGTAHLDPTTVNTVGLRDKAFSFGLDFNSPLFQEFCNFVTNSNMPVVSPLYRGPKVSSTTKLEMKQAIRLSVALTEIGNIIENLSIAEMAALIYSKCIDANFMVIELIVERICDEISTLSRSVKFEGSLSSVIESSIKQLCDEFFEAFITNDSNKIYEQALSSFTDLLSSPLALLSQSDNLIIWNNHYGANSSAVIQSSSPDRKTVTFDEGRNSKLEIKRVDELIEEFDADTENNKPGIFRRIPTVFDLFSAPSANSSAPSFMALPSLIANRRFAADEIPDFPFENPIETVFSPKYIEDTAYYYAEQGDNSCFLLEERLATVNQGIQEFLEDSFSNSKAAESTGNIMKEALRSIFSNKVK